jgi:hypothetical protein
MHYCTYIRRGPKYRTGAGRTQHVNKVGIQIKNYTDNQTSPKQMLVELYHTVFVINTTYRKTPTEKVETQMED